MEQRVSPIGYLGTRLAKKLGIKQGFCVYLVNAPPEYEALLGPLPAGVRYSRHSTSADLAHIFVIERGRLVKVLTGLCRKLKADTPVWVSWPKKASRIASLVTEDIIREIALPLGFVDVKVCAVSEVWSGLKLILRKVRR